MLAYPSIFSRLTTGLDFTTSVCELPCASSTFLTVNTVCRLYILHVVQPADITLQCFLSVAQFLTINSGRRFFLFYFYFLTGPLACCSVLRVNAPVQPRRPSTLTLVLIRRWTHLIPPITPHSPFVPATSCPDSSHTLVVKSRPVVRRLKILGYASIHLWWSLESGPADYNWVRETRGRSPLPPPPGLTRAAGKS